MKNIIESRLSKVRAEMAEQNIQAIALVDSERVGWENVFYLSAFKGSSAVVVLTQDEAQIITDSRYLTQVKAQSPLDIVEIPLGKSQVEMVKEFLSSRNITTCGYDGASLPTEIYFQLEAALPINWVDASIILKTVRRAKDSHEIDMIRKSGEIAAMAYKMMLQQIRPGMTELEVSKILELNIAKLGGQGVWHASSMIVASGVRSAMPHGVASTKIIEAGEWVTVDFGAIYGEYQCDVTRNFSVGPMKDQEFIKIHKILVDAHVTAAKAIAPGVPCKQIDFIARDIIDKAGYSQYFGHGLGHSFGLQIHENPRLAPYSNEILQAGDVVTVEPGIYIPERGGMRLEDDYLVTETGVVRLTDSLPMTLAEIDV